MDISEINSRETYLKFRMEWRIEYNGLTKLIRKTKAERRTGKSDLARSQAQSTCHYLRVRARTMMEQLEEVKAKRPMPQKIAA